jgi:dTDP-4-amino-4,6-dideoxygalactose transaminase
MNVPLLDLKAQYRSIKVEIDAAVAAVFESQYFILGPTVQAFEKDLAAYCHCAHAIGVSSGTDALLLCLMVEGIGPGDEVITSPYSFFATAGSIARLGAKPVFVDIDPVTFNINPALVEAAITPRTKAIMPVHLFGQLADMDAIMHISRTRNVVVIEDACQAIGAEHKGRRAGSIGHYGSFSFFPSKNLGGAGDGGAVTTNDPARAEKLAWFRNHGMNPKYYHKYIGGNFRLDALQAAVVHVKLKHLDRWTDGRRKNAARYNELLAGAGVGLPASVTDRHIYNQYCIRSPKRDALLQHLQKSGIGCEIYYPVPLHQQECFQALGHKAGSFPESEQAARTSLAIPVYPELSAAQLSAVAQAIAGC